MPAGEQTDIQPSSHSETSAAPVKITGTLKPINLEEIQRGVAKGVDLRRESARGTVAAMIIGALLIVIIASFGLMFSSRQISDIKDVVELLIAPVIGIVGAVTGFYFGSSGVNQSRGPE
jgi:hypothetical protein